MNSPIVGLRVAGTVFGLMCLGQLMRLATQAPINVAGFELPLWLSVFGFLFYWFAVPVDVAAGANHRPLRSR